MKRRLFAFLCLLLIVFGVCFSGCNKTRNFTVEEVVAAYEGSGYYVVWRTNCIEDWGDSWDAYVEVFPEKDSKNYVYIMFFDDEAAAKDYKNQVKDPVLLWFVGGMMSGDFRWIHRKQCGNVIYEYQDVDKKLLKPFFKVINSK